MIDQPLTLTHQQRQELALCFYDILEKHDLPRRDLKASCQEIARQLDQGFCKALESMFKGNGDLLERAQFQAMNMRSEFKLHLKAGGECCHESWEEEGGEEIDSETLFEVECFAHRIEDALLGGCLALKRWPGKIVLHSRKDHFELLVIERLGEDGEYSGSGDIDRPDETLSVTLDETEWHDFSAADARTLADEIARNPKFVPPLEIELLEELRAGEDNADRGLQTCMTLLVDKPADYYPGLCLMLSAANDLIAEAEGEQAEAYFHVEMINNTVSMTVTR